MQKEYLDWHKLKTVINNEIFRIPYFRIQQIWWCSLGLNIGFEENGKNSKYERPVLILKKFSKDVLLVLPITSADKQGKYYYQFEYKEKKYSIILSQVRLISSRRLLRKIRRIDNDEFDKIKKKFIKLL